jgi:hypothetical protein
VNALMVLRSFQGTPPRPQRRHAYGHTRAALDIVAALTLLE